MGIDLLPNVNNMVVLFLRFTELYLALYTKVK